MDRDRTPGGIRHISVWISSLVGVDKSTSPKINAHWRHSVLLSILDGLANRRHGTNWPVHPRSAHFLRSAATGSPFSKQSDFTISAAYLIRSSIMSGENGVADGVGAEAVTGADAGMTDNEGVEAVAETEVWALPNPL